MKILLDIHDYTYARCAAKKAVQCARQQTHMPGRCDKFHERKGCEYDLSSRPVSTLIVIMGFGEVLEEAVYD